MILLSAEACGAAVAVSSIQLLAAAAACSSLASPLWQAASSNKLSAGSVSLELVFRWLCPLLLLQLQLLSLIQVAGAAIRGSLLLIVMLLEFGG